jgi:hypothetical protein
LKQPEVLSRLNSTLTIFKFKKFRGAEVAAITFWFIITYIFNYKQCLYKQVTARTPGIFLIREEDLTLSEKSGVYIEKISEFRKQCKNNDNFFYSIKHRYKCSCQYIIMPGYNYI